MNLNSEWTSADPSSQRWHQQSRCLPYCRVWEISCRLHRTLDLGGGGEDQGLPPPIRSIDWRLIARSKARPGRLGGPSGLENRRVSSMKRPSSSHKRSLPARCTLTRVLGTGPEAPWRNEARLNSQQSSVELHVARHFLHHSSLATADHHVSGACTSSPALLCSTRLDQRHSILDSIHLLHLPLQVEVALISGLFLSSPLSWTVCPCCCDPASSQAHTHSTPWAIFTSSTLSRRCLDTCTSLSTTPATNTTSTGHVLTVSTRHIVFLLAHSTASQRKSVNLCINSSTTALHTATCFTSSPRCCLCTPSWTQTLSSIDTDDKVIDPPTGPCNRPSSSSLISDSCSPPYPGHLRIL